MKQRDRFAMQTLNPGSRIYASRSEWELEIIRDPRPSCIDRWKLRNELRELAPGDTATINGVHVYRKKLVHQASRYLIAGKWLDVNEAIAAIEAGKEVAA